jgi:flagellar P-ring protein precursor FlgI
VIRVDTPHNANQRVAFLAQIENLTVDTGVPAARVIINSRTGSVVMNQAVTLEACAVAHGDLSVTISSEPVISQPAPFSRGGRTVVRNRAQIDLKQEGRGIKSVSAGTRLSDVVKALNALGATPLDLIAILQAMKAAGALRAELEII